MTPRETHFDGIHCKLAILHYSSGVVIIRISGTDIGEFGDVPAALERNNHAAEARG
jgi:hypothetical protein